MAQPQNVRAMAFREELRRWGPDSTELQGVANRPTLAQAQAYCRTLAKTHYENFSIASWLVPQALRQDLFHVYAYCRWSDDLADEVESPEESQRLLDWWEHQLMSNYPTSGQRRPPVHPVLIALSSTIDRHQLDLAPFRDLLSAFRQDQHTRRFENDDQVLDYCRRSANPVGRIILQMASVRTRPEMEWSDSICSGLQIANFCQDMQCDARMNRIYMPQSRWRRHGLSEADFFDSRNTQARSEALCQWVSLARSLIVSGWPLVHHVPRWLSRDVQMFARGGFAILDAIERRGFDVWTSRPVIRRSQKLAIMLASLIGRNLPRSAQAALPCPAPIRSGHEEQSNGEKAIVP